jgi:hypothetical protein
MSAEVLATAGGIGGEDQPRLFDTAQQVATVSQVGQFTGGGSHGPIEEAAAQAAHVDPQILAPQPALGLGLTTAAR